MQREDEACIEQDLIMIVITRKLAKNVTAVFILHHRENVNDRGKYHNMSMVYSRVTDEW